jgi:MFS family permease
LAAFSGFEATFSLLGRDRFGLTEASAAVVFVFIGVLLSVVQAGVIRPVTDRFGTLRTLRAGLALDAAGLAVLAVATTWPVLVAALLLLVVGQGLASPTLTTLVSNRAGDARRGQALGRQQAWGSLARVVGPAMAGALFQHVGVPAPYLVGAALAGVALVALVHDAERETFVAARVA